LGQTEDRMVTLEDVEVPEVVAVMVLVVDLEADLPLALVVDLAVEAATDLEVVMVVAEEEALVDLMEEADPLVEVIHDNDFNRVSTQSVSKICILFTASSVQAA
jgi:hypothetical protein